MIVYTPRQIQIINAATELINLGGIQNLTTKSLADRMDFSEPALYRHFKGKTEILSSVLNYFGYELNSKLIGLLEGKGTGFEKLKRIIEFQFEHFAKHPAIVMVIFAETSFQYEEILSDAVRNILVSKKKRLELIILQGQEDGSIRSDVDGAQLATIFMGTMRFTILQWRLSDYKFDLIQEGEKLWESLGKILTK
ncbi:MAG: TetR/AcrR family transcriptional regulator [Flavobacteriales bacterium]